MLIPYVASCQDNPYTPGLLARAYSLWLAKSKSMNIAHKDSALKLHVSVEANMFQTEAYMFQLLVMASRMRLRSGSNRHCASPVPSAYAGQQ